MFSGERFDCVQITSVWISNIVKYINKQVITSLKQKINFVDDIKYEKSRCERFLSVTTSDKSKCN